MTDLKPCPFCGDTNIEIINDGGNMKSWPALTIFCSNKDCSGMVRYEYDEFSTDLDALKIELINNWNRRV